MARPIEKARYSKLIALGFVYNVIQSMFLFFNPASPMNWFNLLSIVVPVLFISYFAMRLEKIAYLLFLYWFFILSFTIQTNWVTLTWLFGTKLNWVLIADKFEINPATLMICVIALFEVDKVFPPEENQAPLLTSEEVKTADSLIEDQI